MRSLPWLWSTGCCSISCCHIPNSFRALRWARNPAPRLLVQLAGWTLMWLIAAFIATAFREELPRAAYFFGLLLAISAFLTWRNWTPVPAAVTAPNLHKIGARQHARSFLFWAAHGA